MRRSIFDHTWLITGISSGIGYELTVQLLEQGCSVAGIVRDMNGVAALQNKYPDSLFVYEADLTEFDAVEKIVNAILNKHRVLVLASNAGMSIKGKAEEISANDIKKLVDTNLVGSMLVIRSCIPYFKEHGGKIIQIGSLSSQVAIGEWSYYCASKFGIAGFCESLSYELKDYPISVMIVEPGNVNTALWKKLGDESLSCYSNKTDISVKKLAKRIITVSRCDEMPLYLPMGSISAKRINESISKRLSLHKKMAGLAGDVDEEYPQAEIRLPKMIGQRDMYIWPLGTEIKNALLNMEWCEIDTYLEGFIDNTDSMTGRYFCGRAVVDPSFVDGKSSQHYIVIGSKKYYEDISFSLKLMGYEEIRDYCYWRDLIYE